MFLKGLCYGMFLQHKDELRTAIRKCGQLARADYGDGMAEAFLWDGLALVRRGDEAFVNEPHAGDAPKKLCFGGQPRAKRSARRARKGPRGNPVVSSKGAAYFNDVLGTTVGVREGRRAARKGAKRRCTAAALTAFGEPVPVAATSHNSNIRQFDHSIISSPFFTGKPQVEGLGRVFLCRNYRADLAKWQTADPLGYPDGWNQLAYCGNDVTSCIDYLGAACEFHITDVRWRGYLLKDVWAECNHSFEHPNLTIVMGEKANVVYTPSLELLIDGVMHQFQFDLHLTYSTTIKRKDRWNKEIIYQGSVTIKVIETWTEDIVDDDGNVIGHAPQRLTHSDVVKPFEGSHNIPE